MQLKSLFVVAAVQVAAAFAAAEGQVLEQEKIYHAVISQSPFLVEMTTTITWTEGASITDTSLPTAAPTPSVAY
ncbi:hypothetical protein D9619_006807 [Psilocybe cf. subviscida]|uniref:Uncharacterized protein n=1 Tax=Psilocybe cf. subviscida TaxID=2480587 RepID=A0A8H5B6N6_9AGAR|nr:hypothetical protein D9619_006807 [Psilocybe cf. subviscida]